MSKDSEKFVLKLFRMEYICKRGAKLSSPYENFIVLETARTFETDLEISALQWTESTPSTLNINVLIVCIV